MPNRTYKPRIPSLQNTSLLARAGIHQDPLSAIQKGFPYSVIENLSKLIGLEINDIARYANITESKLKKCSIDNKFSTKESDCLYSIAAIFEGATDLYNGDETKAKAWLTTPAKALDGKEPLELSSTTSGLLAVLNLIGRIENGVLV